MAAKELDEFGHYTYSLNGISHTVYVTGSGAPILVMHELPGLAHAALRFSLRLASEGFQVHTPHLFGEIGKSEPLRNYRSLCVSKEFGRLATGSSAPITQWLRGLTQHISRQNNGSKVGAIGMCLTGSFVIPLMLDPWVVAPVAAHPAIPFSLLYLITGLGGTSWAKEFNIAEDELASTAQVLSRDGRKLLALRYKEDRLCPAARFERLRAAFGPQVETLEYEGTSMLRSVFCPRHSVLTGEYAAGGGNSAAHDAFERVCSFMRENFNRH